MTSPFAYAFELLSHKYLQTCHFVKQRILQKLYSATIRTEKHKCQKSAQNLLWKFLPIHTHPHTHAHKQLQGALDSHLQFSSSLILSEDWIDPIYVI